MRRYSRFTQPIGQSGGGAFRQPPRINEDQCGVMLIDQLFQAVINFNPDLIGHNRFERRPGDFNQQIALPDMAGVDNCAGHITMTGQIMRDVCQRFLRGRQADAYRRLPR